MRKDKRTKRKLDTNPPALKSEVGELPFSAKSNPDDQVQTKLNEGAHTEPPPTVRSADASHSKRQRVKDAAREIVDENVRPRVEKLRHASSVVLEEAAAIDPSLRFLLIAIFLFIVFIVMLALSFVR